MREFWVNVYARPDGTQYAANRPHVCRDGAMNAVYASDILFDRQRKCVGRWKITLKEQEPRHDR